MLGEITSYSVERYKPPLLCSAPFYLLLHVGEVCID